jgi:hypothetical protein
MEEIDMARSSLIFASALWLACATSPAFAMGGDGGGGRREGGRDHFGDAGLDQSGVNVPSVANGQGHSRKASTAPASDKPGVGAKRTGPASVPDTTSPAK